MNILNITFNKITAEKQATPKGRISVKNNVKLENVEESKIGIEGGKKTLKLSYSYTADYSPDFAKIEILGEVLVLEDAKKAEEMLKKWDKDKKLDAEDAVRVINSVMSKASLQTMILARDLNLPSPIQLPKLKPSGKKEE